ncbi:MAG: hypothetical protein AAB964_01325 [Patescibacteria group bacterium]
MTLPYDLEVDPHPAAPRRIIVAASTGGRCAANRRPVGVGAGTFSTIKETPMTNLNIQCVKRRVNAAWNTFADLKEVARWKNSALADDARDAAYAEWREAEEVLDALIAERKAKQEGR